VPSSPPKGLVVFFHGHGHTAEDWANHHLLRVAEANDVIALAMDYPLPEQLTAPADAYTWQVAEGAHASNVVAKALKTDCGLATVVAYGVIMGGNASGIALAESGTNKDFADLYNWWFDIEGADNVIETYNEARALAPANAFAAGAQHGIEAEMGGPIETVPDAYRDHTNLFRVDDIAASGIGGVVMVHAVDDGLVPYNQQREMQAALLSRGKSVQFWTVVTKGRPDPQGDTTVDGYIPVPHDPPLAGHSNETNPDSRVSFVGFDRLDALFAGSHPDSSGDFVYDEDSGQYTKP